MPIPPKVKAGIHPGVKKRIAVSRVGKGKGKGKAAAVYAEEEEEEEEE